MIFHLLAPTEESKETTEGQPAGGQGMWDWSQSCGAPRATKRACLVPWGQLCFRGCNANAVAKPHYSSD